MPRNAPEVRIGQVWKDWDSRYREQDPGRTLEVVDPSLPNGKVLFRVLTDSDGSTRSQVGRHVEIMPSRLVPNSTGYKLIEDRGTDVK